ncbi:hypothetical protein APSETT444_003715 [Aspergillus pseudonomiae]
MSGPLHYTSAPGLKAPDSRESAVIQVQDADELRLAQMGIFTAASTNLVYASNFMALIALYHDDIKLKPWMTFVAYQVLNVLTSAVVMFGNRYIPRINKFASSNMNYTCVCVGGFIIIELLWWLIAGKRYSKTMQKAREEGSNVMVRVDSKNL